MRYGYLFLKKKKKLSPTINFAIASLKHYFELKFAREKEIIDLIASEELETSIRANQVKTLPKAGDTHCSSFYFS